eukprot:TRINITY_DN11624_c0_g1_i1.p1 TRINITY_DN11624_c0_g1~~TRINITY_DN11624_c0_g1_i1.p1  ORF type:complete len:639 (+),score=105.99 TRINITY_DN11624_c0_g1_i1:47-1918(+)
MKRGIAVMASYRPRQKIPTTNLRSMQAYEEIDSLLSQSKFAEAVQQAEALSDINGLSKTALVGLMQACARLSQPDRAEDLYRRWVQRSLSPPVEACAELLIAYAKEGRGPDVLRLLTSMKDRLNVELGLPQLKEILQVLCLAGCPEQAEKFVSRAEQLYNISFDYSALATIAVAYQNAAQRVLSKTKAKIQGAAAPDGTATKKASQVEDSKLSSEARKRSNITWVNYRMDECRLAPVLIDDDLLLQLIPQCAALGRLGDIAELLRLAKDNSLTSTPFNKLAYEYLERGDHEKVSQVITSMMREHNIPPSEYTFCILIHANRKDVSAARWWFDSMLRHKIDPDEVHLNALLNAEAESGTFADAWQTYQEVLLHFPSIIPSHTTFSIMFKAVLNGGKPEDADLVHAEMKKHKVQYNGSILSLLIRIHNMDPATVKMWFDEFYKHDIQPDVAQLNHVLRSMAQTGQCNEAIALFKEYSSRHPLVTFAAPTFNLLLQACEKANMPNRAAEVLRIMADLNIVPGNSTYAILIHLHRHDPETAKSIFEKQLSLNNCQPQNSYRILMKMLLRAGKIEEALQWFERIARDYGILPSENLYKLLQEACDGHASLATRLRAAMTFIGQDRLPT